MSTHRAPSAFACLLRSLRIGAVALCAALGCVASASATPWLFVTDLHVDPTARSARPIEYGDDTNPALLRSTIAEMKRVDPHAPVIVIGGDYLAHTFTWSHANATMTDLAHRFNAAFPNAQFVITLGNEDSSCGDYALAPRSTFLREVARTWAPLVNRHGAAPDFATTFARDGFYTTRLPIAHTQAVVIDDVFWSPRYRACTPNAGNPAAMTIRDLTHALHASSDRHWIVLHIPPGIDAYSTAYLAHHLVVVPFLDPRPRDALLHAIADPRAHVTLVLAAHTHKFAYRIVGAPGRPVPMLLVPSVSPIFGNAPSFLTADVDAGGTLRTIDDHVFLHRQWRKMEGLSSLGVSRFTGSAVVDLQYRLARDPKLRARFALLYESGARPEINARNWPTYWCAATSYTATAFRACTGQGGVSFVTTRGIIAGALAFALVLGIAAAGWFLLRPTTARKRRAVERGP
jgi:hypothetical protein